jgi:hypothetical protein
VGNKHADKIMITGILFVAIELEVGPPVANTKRICGSLGFSPPTL